MTLVFQAGEYEDDIPGNSTFEDGDGDFTSADIVHVFQLGHYAAAAAAASEPAQLLDDAPASARHLYFVDLGHDRLYSPAIHLPVRDLQPVKIGL